MAGTDPSAPSFEGVELPLDAEASASGRAAVTGEPVLVNDVERASIPIHRDLVRAHRVRSFLATPLRVREPGPGRPHRERRGAGPVRRGGRGAAGRGGQPRGARHRQGRELPDHRGAVPRPRGQGAGPHRAAAGHQRGAAGRLPRSAGHPAPAHPAREDGLGRPARGGRRPRAQQSDRVHLLERGHARRLRPAPAEHARDLPGRAAPGGGPRARSRRGGAS